MVRLFNRSTGTFTHGQWRLRPGFGNVPADVAALWLDQFPDRIIKAADAETSGESVTKELNETKIQLEAANRRIVDIEEQLKRANAPASVAPKPVPLIRPAAPAPIGPVKIVSKPAPKVAS